MTNKVLRVFGSASLGKGISIGSDYVGKMVGIDGELISTIAGAALLGYGYTMKGKKNADILMVAGATAATSIFNFVKKLMAPGVPTLAPLGLAPAKVAAPIAGRYRINVD